MRLLLFAIVIAAIVSLLSAAGVSAEPSVSVDRSMGSAGDTYTFSGIGFAPGTALRGKYVTPNGKEYGFSEGYGEKSFVAGSDGAWQYGFMPSSSPYGGGAAGTWTMTFCLAQDASTCWSSEFKVDGGMTRGTGGEPGMGGY
jgi:hypothetical protein